MVDLVPGTANRAKREVIDGKEVYTPIVDTSGSGSGGAGGLTNTELRAAPLEVHPGFATGGNISVSTAANGTDFVVFTARACAQLTVVNDSDVVFEVRQGGAGVACPVLSQSSFTFFGISNANQLSVRRKDTGTEPLTVYARWES